MGSRGNTYLTHRNDKSQAITDHIDLYWHSDGHNNENYTRIGLKACKPRWNDPSYGTAMFLGALDAAKKWPSGISIGSFDDNEHDLFEVCWTDRKVRKWPRNAHAKSDILNDLSKALESWTFQEFVDFVVALPDLE
jgi:hypothetical protein